MDYSIKIDAFDGPLDLLLHLIKEGNTSIYDIEINEITKQYLDYINKMEELNINVASEYIVMAAELMEIKSKSLLPQKEEENLEDEDEEVSKENLINKLIEYQKYKDMTDKFKELELGRQNIYIKAPEKVSNYIDKGISNDEGITVDDLTNAFKEFLFRLDKEKPITTKITSKEYSMKERKSSIRKLLKERKNIKFQELFDIKSMDYIVVTFLSILEMTKEKEVVLKQDDNFKDIVISGKEG